MLNMTSVLMFLEEQYVMLVYMLILAELAVGGMTWNLLLTLLFSFFEAGFHGKGTRERTKVSLFARRRWPLPQKLFAASVPNLFVSLSSMWSI